MTFRNDKGLYRCYYCKQYLSKDEFAISNTRSRGVASICKSCDSKKNAKYEKDNKGKCAEADSKYYQKNKKRLAKKASDLYKENPIQVNCKCKVAYAKKTGKLVVGDCAKCGISKKEMQIDAHHPDYNKPLEVVWLCRSCHLKLHSKLGREVTT